MERFWLLCVVVSAVLAGSCRHIFTGESGVGKSYLCNTLGCFSSTCDAAADPRKSCTESAVVCENAVDAVGDDNSYDVTVTGDDGRPYTISGYSYPAFNLLETFEKYHISCGMFYDVYDSSNPRRGQSGELMAAVIRKFNCPVTTLWNKYDPVRITMDIVRPGDMTVAWNQESINFTGVECHFALDPQWRTAIIDKDWKAISNNISIAQCERALVRQEELQAILDTPETPDPVRPIPEEAPTETCATWQITGNECKSRVLGVCVNDDNTYGWVVNQACKLRVEQQIQIVKDKNELAEKRYNNDRTDVANKNSELRKQQSEARAEKIGVDDLLDKCKHIPNYSF